MFSITTAHNFNYPIIINVECIYDIVDYICLSTANAFCIGKKIQGLKHLHTSIRLQYNQFVTTRPPNCLYYFLRGRYLNVSVPIRRFGNACI